MPFPSLTVFLRSLRGPALVAAGLLLTAGCGRHAPPAALAEADIPAAMEKAFLKAKPEVRALAKRAVESFQGTNFPQAVVELESLCALKDIKPAQREIASQFLLTANQRIEAAQAAGDQNAAELRRVQRSSK